MRRALRFFAAALVAAGCAGEPAAPAPRTPAAPGPEPLEVDHLDADVLLAIDDPADHAEILRLADELAGEALAGVAPDAPPRTKLLHLNWYIHAHFESQVVAPFSLLEVLRRRHANCTASAAIMQLMARTLGIPSRTVGIFGIPVQAGHTTVEFYWDGAWHFFDPTFGVFFTADGTFEGEILSITTIMKHRAHIAANAFYPVSEGRKGWGYAAAKPASLEAMYSRTQTVMLEGGSYGLFLATASGATPYDAGYVLNTIYAVDLAGRDAFALGEDDDSGADVTLHRPEGSPIPNDYDGAGLSFVGRWHGNYGPLTAVQSHVITGLVPGARLRLTLDAVDQPGGAFAVSVRKGRVASSSVSGTKARFEIEALRDEVVVTVRDPAYERPHFTRLDFFEYRRD